MAYLFEKTGLIRDRSRGHREISYSVPRQGKSFMKACKEAHETIISLLPMNIRENITAKELRQHVLLFVNLNQEARREMIARLVLPYGSGIEKLGTHTLAELFELWKKGKIAEGFVDEHKFDNLKKVMLDFFRTFNLKTTNDLTFHTAHDFMFWRGKTRYKKGNPLTSASVIRKELDVLKQMNRLAFIQGWVHNGNLWDSVKPKAKAGINLKIVEPLSIEEQKEMLKNLRHKNEGCHDLALLLLITGMRLGEIKAVKPDSIKNGVITLHGEFIGNHKTTGKTSSSNRNLPVCPTIAKLFERGNIFKTTSNALSVVFKRNFKGVHAHRLRHTFAVNKLLSGENLQMVSYQLGHKGTQITADLYGKFEPKHFKAGFEQTKTERQGLLRWLEEGYF
jgi:integrase